MKKRTLVACATAGVLAVGALSAPAVASAIESAVQTPSSSVVIPGGIVSDEASVTDVPLIDQVISSRPTVEHKPDVVGVRIVPVEPPDVDDTPDGSSDDGSGGTPRTVPAPDPAPAPAQPNAPQKPSDWHDWSDSGWSDWRDWAEDRWDKWQDRYGDGPKTVRPADPHQPDRSDRRDRDDDRDNDWSR
jgi:hypothetical protein